RQLFLLPAIRSRCRMSFPFYLEFSTLTAQAPGAASDRRSAPLCLSGLVNFPGHNFPHRWRLVDDRSAKSEFQESHQIRAGLPFRRIAHSCAEFRLDPE